MTPRGIRRMSREQLMVALMGRDPSFAPGRRSMPEIAAEIAAAHGVTVEHLRGPIRTRKIAHARQAFMAAAWEQPHLSLTIIGRWLGNRDHTTVLQGVKAHRKRIAEAEA